MTHRIASKASYTSQYQSFVQHAGLLGNLAKITDQGLKIGKEVAQQRSGKAPEAIERGLVYLKAMRTGIKVFDIPKDVLEAVEAFRLRKWQEGTLSALSAADNSFTVVRGIQSLGAFPLDGSVKTSVNVANDALSLGVVLPTIALSAYRLKGEKATVKVRQTAYEALQSQPGKSHQAAVAFYEMKVAMQKVLLRIFHISEKVCMAAALIAGLLFLLACPHIAFPILAAIFVIFAASIALVKLYHTYFLTPKPPSHGLSSAEIDRALQARKA